LLVGTIAIGDLRTLGLVRVSADLSKWTSSGLITMWVTGPLLFGADWGRYTRNPAFLVKMGLLTAALLTHFTVRRSHRKAAAVASLILWSCVVLAGRAIADFDV